MIGIGTLLEQAKLPDGRRRFYPAGDHPATRRLRQHLEHLRTHPVATEDRAAAISFAERDLARFEYGEQRAQSAYVRGLMGYIASLAA